MYSYIGSMIFFCIYKFKLFVFLFFKFVIFVVLIGIPALMNYLHKWSPYIMKVERVRVRE